MVATLCRDCATLQKSPAAGRCRACGSPRLISHDELLDLSIAHIDCDAFFASVEKRDHPELAAKPVIIGGGRRGVVAAACYVARRYGIRSAMPMFQAMKLCPHAVVIRPDKDKYSAVGKQIRAMMQDLSPLVEPLSIDEAFIDLTGTQDLHKGSPAATMIRLVKRIEAEAGVSASIGLSYNKFLAKVASDLDKPRGFAVIGKGEALDFLENKSVSLLWGVGKATRARLEKDGVRTIGQIRTLDEGSLVRKHGVIGQRLYEFAWGRDSRIVTPDAPTKSVSNETTLDRDVGDLDTLSHLLWDLSEKVARRLKKEGLAGSNVTLKLKTKDFKTITRSHQLGAPTQMADVLYREAMPLLTKELDGRRFRLIGIGAAKITEADGADPPDLLDPEKPKRANVERTMDALRARFGDNAVIKGRSLK